MEIPNDIAIICEDKLDTLKHVEKIMSDPYAPMHSEPIRQKENAQRIIDSYNVFQYNLPDASKYPLLYNYMLAIKKAEEEKLKRYEERKRIESSFEFQLKKRQNEIQSIDLHISDVIKNISYYETQLEYSKKEKDRLNQLFMTKMIELEQFKNNKY
jgi:hypothetical protein